MKCVLHSLVLCRRVMRLFLCEARGFRSASVLFCAGLLAFLFAAVMLGGCGGREATPPTVEVAQPEVPPPPPPPKPIALAPLSPISVDPGAKVKVELKVDRAGNSGPIDLAVSGAPAGVKVNISQIPDGESVGLLEIVVDQKLGDEELKAPLKIQAKHITKLCSCGGRGAIPGATGNRESSGGTERLCRRDAAPVGGSSSRSRGKG